MNGSMLHPELLHVFVLAGSTRQYPFRAILCLRQVGQHLCNLLGKFS
jgi:hypothetical protein